MKRLLSLVLAIPIALLILAALPAEQPVPLTRAQQWEKVREATAEGLPRTAMEHLEPIIEDAMKEGAHAEAIRAIGQKVALEGNIQGNKPEEKIVMFAAEMARAPEEMRPLMHAVLAHWTWHYFQQNRWRFMQRTATAEAPGEDITTWDLPRIFAEIDTQFTAALAAAEVLKATPVAEFDELLEKGTMPDSYRPTLYDFVASQALQFYTSGEQAAARPQDAFVLSADSAIFAPAEDFIRWEPETTDTASPVYKAVLLYQDLLRFHHGAGNEDAFIDWDLDRLRFGYNSAAGEEKTARYKAALGRFVDRWNQHEISALALHARATLVHEEGELAEAHALATRGARMHPKSPGGVLCLNLIQQIEAPEASLHTERVWDASRPPIQIRYRNISEVHFRLVAWNWEKDLATAPPRHPEQLDHEQRTALLAEKALLTWSSRLPATPDFQERAEEWASPADLKPGFYFLLASHDAAFSDANNVVSFAPVWVSDLALIVRTRHGEPVLEGFVLDAATGEPLADAEVRAWVPQRWDQPHTALKPVQTDADGLFRFEESAGRAHILLARHGEQRLATARAYSAYGGGRQDPSFTRTVFFTDRAIYRPGQTIRYKGIAIEVNQGEDRYQTLANRTVTVVFNDVNGREIEQQQVRTNDYGSFNGSFTAPRDRLMGRMNILTHDPSGSTAVTVEEYKRPTFQVELAPPGTAPRLHETVSVPGTATAYTGAATDGAQVRWRVVREVRFPPWMYGRHWWWNPMPQGGQEIAHGVATTEVDGSFEIEFTARPDLSVAEKDEPVFQFTVHADVTDTAGETRSSMRIVNVGYTALAANLTADAWQTVEAPVKMALRTTTLDGEGLQATGVVKVYSLLPPETVQRAPLRGPHFPMPRMPGIQLGGGTGPGPEPDLSNPAAWPLDKVVGEQRFVSDTAGHATLEFELEAGAYRAVLETSDRFGKTVRAELPLTVLEPDAGKLALKVPHLFAAPAWTLEPGEKFTALWGSGYDQARAYVEIEHRGRMIQSYWTRADRPQEIVVQQVTEAMRGGFTVHVTMVRENRAYLESRRVEVPWSNKQLEIAWERFRSRLDPAQEEQWTAVIRGPDAEKTVAEMVATLYDQSLDAFLPHDWMAGFDVFRRDPSSRSSNFENTLVPLQHLVGRWPRTWHSVSITYRAFPQEVIANLWGYQFFGGRGGSMRNGVPQPMVARARGSEGVIADEMMAAEAAPGMEMDKAMAAPEEPGEAAAADEPAPDAALDQVTARRNLEETAFFFPHLVSGEDGTVRMSFTMPEALTQWKFLGFAHDRDLRSGLLTDSTVTAKDLMIQPNPPRFLREGDVLEFTVRVTNQSAARQEGTVRLSFSDARSGDSVDAALGNTRTEQAFDVPSKESRTYAWRIEVPDGIGYLTYRAVGSTGQLSDGEEGYLPVLSRYIFVTESIQLPIRGPGTRDFRFEKLLASGDSDTLRHQTLTVQMVSNPTWYAVMALPYLMEYPHPCSEQVFNRLYANTLARHIANADPRIRRVFDQWKATPALDSPLTKNEDLKAVALEETPWVRQAEEESQARRNVGILFDQNRLNDEMARAMHQLTQMQLADGSWPWFPEGRPNDYITLYITTGFGRLRHLGTEIDVAPAVRALTRLDTWADEVYRRILRGPDPEAYVPDTTIALYLYGRSFFLKDQPIAQERQEAVDFFLRQSRLHWLRLGHRQSQAHLAIALQRFGDRETPRAIMASIRERSVSDEELGMFWRELEFSWWWYRAPIETQAMMIEAFDEVMNDAEAVEDCKVWLLKQKQTQHWRSTKATADAVYALLLRGTDGLASEALVEVELAGTVIEPEQVEAGTGFYERRFVRGEIEPAMGEVTVTKVDEGVAWGGLHWQYLEDISKITPHTDNPLTLEKVLYTKVNTPRGPELQRVDGPVSVGDELVVRIVLRTDRDMEYVHMKDHRGSGTEPVNVLSRYRYQDGLAYYESTRDTASHFFIDYLPKGTYVFEYSVRVQHRGQYQTGMANIQCMYAPEFNSHSETIELMVE